MKLSDIPNRDPQPTPWLEGEKIPWDDPDFSRRMLKEHLSQDHDAASRRFPRIDGQVAWIHKEVLHEKPSRVLDLGCGPGLYASRLAKLGHACAGIDFSPASIEYARSTASNEKLNCTYFQGDIRRSGFGSNYDLVMFIYGELNVFRIEDAALILGKACLSLAPGGTLLLEVHTYDTVLRMGGEAASWYSSQEGLFSDQPHLVLTDNLWHKKQQAAVNRYYVIDADKAGVTRYSSTTQAYTEEQYRKLLENAGFRKIEWVPSLTGDSGELDKDFHVIRAGSPA
jgi:SAM-dependent methyltransferase